MSFSGQIKEFTEKVKRHEKPIEIMMDLFQGTVTSTPVDSGFARANWLVTHNQPYRGTISDFDKSGDLAIRKAEVQLEGFEAGVPVFISNSAPYIGVLEYEGHSAQSPDGMVRINIQRVKSKYL